MSASKDGVNSTDSEQHLAAQGPERRAMTCPTCGRHTCFQHLGSRVWPEAVADVMGLPQRVHTWQCDACQTTITLAS